MNEKHHTPPLVRNHHHPFFRNEGGEITTIALLKVTTQNPMPAQTILRKLIEIITEWVRNTHEGRKAWQDSSGDFNIGDFALVEETFKKSIPHSRLTRVGIIDFEVLEVCDSTGAVPFDRVLVNAATLPTDWHLEA